MTQNNQAKPHTVIAAPAAIFEGGHKLWADAFFRAKQQLEAGDCKFEVGMAFAAATTPREKILATTLLMADSEIDALSDFLEGLAGCPAGEPTIIL